MGSVARVPSRSLLLATVYVQVMTVLNCCICALLPYSFDSSTERKSSRPANEESIDETDEERANATQTHQAVHAIPLIRLPDELELSS